jgi:hypothetical protein
MKKTNSTIVDTIVMASRDPLMKAGILLRISNPNTTKTALIYVDFFMTPPLLE